MQKHSLKTTLMAGAALALVAGGISWKLMAQSHASEPQKQEAQILAPSPEGEHKEEHAENVKFDDAQMVAAGIKIAAIDKGVLSREVIVPGKIVAAADKMAQIVPKAGGIVTEARKNLGDTVEKGEVMALIESREMAEAVADFQAAKRAEDLTRTTYNREKNLWQKKITAEQDYLNAKNAHEEAAIRLDLTRQKLKALGVEGDASSSGGQRFHELKAPLSGRVIGRELTLGEYVDTTHTAYTVADLSLVWVETAISPADLPFVKEGQMASVTSGSAKGQGKLVFISPAIDPATRSAKAIIELDNQEGHWRAGDFANAAIGTATQEADLIVPKDAIQTVEGKPSVFVRTQDGFNVRPVTTGKEDSRHIEITSGLQPGEQVAVSGTFTLKADFGKSEASHDD